MRFFLPILLCLPVIVFSQDDIGYTPGYMIMSNGDTLSGLIKHINRSYQVLDRKIKFEKDEHSKAQVFTAEEVKEFVLLGESRYLSMKVKSDSLKDFLQLVIDGYLSYYAIEVSVPPTRTLNSFGGASFNPGGTSYSCEILQKKNERIYSLDKAYHNFKDNITEYLADDSDLCKQIKTGYYTEKDIQLIVEAYNTFKAASEPKNIGSLRTKIPSNNCDGQYVTIAEINASFKNGETAFTDSLVNYLKIENVTLLPGAVIFRLIIFRNGDVSEVKKSGGGMTNEELLQEWLTNAHGIFLPATQDGNVVCSYQHLKITVKDDYTIEASIF